MKRDNRGRFARTKKWLVVVAIVGGLLIVGSYGLVDQFLGRELSVSAAVVPEAVAQQIVARKVAGLQSELLNDISACETQGVKEPDGAILLDSNAQMSIGSWQWQIKSVQHYVKQFEGRDISRVDAIGIAIDHEKAMELARKVIFQEKDGWKNWLNCGVKSNAGVRVAIINELAK